MDERLDQLERAIIDIARRMFGRGGSIVTPDGQRLDKASYFMLGWLEQSGAIRLTELATCAQLDTSTVSRQVRTLEDAGLVIRKPDPDDRRAALVELSPAGINMLKKLRAIRHELLESALSGWSPGDRDHLISQLQTLASGLDTVKASSTSQRSDSREALPA